jgi:hypothetical protein
MSRNVHIKLLYPLIGRGPGVLLASTTKNTKTTNILPTYLKIPAKQYIIPI